MAITDINGIVGGLAQKAQRFVIDKGSLATQVAGLPCSLWRAAGIPAQGAIPTGAAVCDKSLAGAFQFSNPASGETSHIARASLLSSNSATDVQFHDRLAHRGGLSGTLITAQAVDVDVSGSSANLEARRGDANYSDVQWWMEWYTATGVTGVTATVTYTNAAGVSGRTTTVALTASVAASRLFPIIGSGGEFIQSVQTVQMSASTGTVGNFGVTASRSLCSLSMGLANSAMVYDWAMLGLPRVQDDACVSMVCFPGTTSSGTLKGTANLIQG